MPRRVLQLKLVDEPGALHKLTGVIADNGANILTLETGVAFDGVATVYVELDDSADLATLAGRLQEMPEVLDCSEPRPMDRIFGARLIVIGGGAQVAAVASGAVQEADRHNIRGERISVDTIPLVGEAEIAEAVRAVPRLPRARALVLAGSLMGGEITAAVRECRAAGIPVITLNQAGSVVDEADLVVSDPLQCGVMAVMAIANTARFDLERVRGRRY
jgi:energy-converting hydrogenase B subunit Q